LKLQNHDIFRLALSANDQLLGILFRKKFWFWSP